MATSVTIVTVEGPFSQKENAAGSSTVSTVTRWIVTAQLPDGRRVSASWTAAVYASADMKAALGAAVTALLAAQNPDTGSTQLV